MSAGIGTRALKEAASAPSRSPLRLKPISKPVADIGDADRQIVALAVLVAAFFEGEHLERLVLGTDRIKQSARVLHRDLRIALAVREKIRTLDFLGDAGEAKALELFQCIVDVLDAEHPHDVLARHRKRGL